MLLENEFVRQVRLVLWHLADAEAKGNALAWKTNLFFLCPVWGHDVLSAAGLLTLCLDPYGVLCLTLVSMLIRLVFSLFLMLNFGIQRGE